MTRKTTHVAGRRGGRLLDSLHVAKTTARFEPSSIIFTQGERASSIMYIESGRVRLSVASARGMTKVVAMLHSGAFFGEGALAGQRRRRLTAESITTCTIAIVKTTEMRRRLLTEPTLSDWFRSHMLARNAQIEADLVEHIFNGCEKRLARALMLLSHFDEHKAARYALPKISRNLLAEMVGTSRSRVDSLMNNFRKLGFIELNSERNGGVQVHRSMLNVVLHG